jgi:hypothetical protein
MFATACKTKSRAELATEVLLTRGTGAVMVVFPKPAFFERTTWMAQVELNGPASAETLPRMPLADIQSILVMNVPPGTYTGTAVSFIRGRQPVFGGALDSVVVMPGEVTILQGRDISREQYPFGGVRVRPSSRALWTLKRADLLQAYVAQLAAQSARG